MKDYKGTERRKENIFMQERIAVLEEKSEKIEKHIEILDIEFKQSRESIIEFSNKIPALVKALENLTEELKEHKKNLSDELKRSQEETKKHKDECKDIDSRLFFIETKFKEDKIKVEYFMRRNWRIGILGGFVGGLLGKLTPDLVKIFVGILSKIFVGF